MRTGHTVVVVVVLLPNSLSFNSRDSLAPERGIVLVTVEKKEFSVTFVSGSHICCANPGLSAMPAVPPPSQSSLRASTPEISYLLLEASPLPLRAIAQTHAFASLTPAIAARLLPPLRGHGAVLASRDAPPAVLRPFWLGLARAHAASLKDAASGRRAEILAGLGALIGAGRRFPGLGGEGLAAFAAVAVSAMGVAGRVVREKDATDAEIVAALGVVLAVAEAAPAQLRRGDGAGMEGELWMLVARGGDVGRGAAAVIVALPCALPIARRAAGVAGVVERAAKEIERLGRAFVIFAEGKGGLLEPDIAQAAPGALVRRFEGYLTVLVRGLRPGGGLGEVRVCVGEVVSALLGVLEKTEVVDPYAQESGKLSVLDVVAITSAWRVAVLEGIAEVVPALGRSALLPFSLVVSRALGRVLTLSARVMARGKDGLAFEAHRVAQSAAGLAERSAAYLAARACVVVLRAPAAHAFCRPLAVCLELDLPFALASSRQAVRNGAGEGGGAGGDGLTLGDVGGGRRGRKRARFTNGGDENSAEKKEAFSSADFDPADLRGVFADHLGVVRVDATIRGLALAESIFGTRGLLDNEALGAMLRIELKLASGLPLGQTELCRALVRAVAACVLSGGSGRMDGLASPVLGSVLCSLRTLAATPGHEAGLASDIQVALASCEALIHTRGPPMITSLGRNRRARGGDAMDVGRPAPPSVAEMLRSIPSFGQKAPESTKKDFLDPPAAAEKMDEVVAEEVAEEVVEAVGLEVVKESSPAAEKILSSEKDGKRVRFESVEKEASFEKKGEGDEMVPAQGEPAEKSAPVKDAEAVTVTPGPDATKAITETPVSHLEDGKKDDSTNLHISDIAASELEEKQPVESEEKVSLPQADLDFDDDDEAILMSIDVEGGPDEDDRE